MSPRAIAYGMALVFFAFGIWATYWGWRQEWTVNGVMLRGGGILALVAGIYALVRGRRPPVE